MKSVKFNNEQIFTALFLVALVLLGFGGYQYYVLNSEFKQNKEEFALATESFEKRIKDLESERNSFAEAYYSEQSKNLAFEKQINEIASTVGVLEKLKKTDPELLQKYSKVYFLNEHYIPSALAEITPKYVISHKDQWIQKDVWPFLEKMILAAETADADLRVISAYRTFDEQADVKEGHVVTYGGGTANQFSAEQGYSEHQLGTALDFTTPELDSSFAGFAATDAYKWLQNNAYQYGFILSYSENNDYYQFEPWHWRFVGRELARRLHTENKNFYDLDQREIEKYLVSFFD
jgi:D-alanyl-D-alanine carboxypeptidase